MHPHSRCVLTSFQALTFLIPKLYSNSVLSSLNSRKLLRALGKPSDELGGVSRGYHSTHSAHGDTGTRHAEVVSRMLASLLSLTILPAGFC